MSKIGASYESVMLGVSQQVPQDRRSGQHGEQVNMISDPVRGLARRWGSRWMDEELIPGGVANLMDFAKMREYTFVVDSVEYSFIYRGHRSESGQGRENLCFLYNKTENRFLNVSLHSDAFLDTLAAGGISAVTCVGRYLYIAGNDVRPTYTQFNAWQDPGNRAHMAAWVRSGAYSRTYMINLVRADGSKVTVSYKTKPSAYPGVHDTSGIVYDPNNPGDYQKRINDANNLYNSKVTAYIGEAAADITPENIAQQLVNALASLGIPASRFGSTVCITDSAYVDIQTDDGGDGSTMVGVGNEVNSVEKLSTVHVIGKVVRVRPRGAQAKEAFYMKAFAKSGAGFGWGEVIWREAPGVLTTPQSIFAVATVSDPNTFAVAPNPATLNAWVGVNSPPLYANEVGDGASAPVPYFFGKRITLLSVFQDRLVVGSEGTVSMSRPGDYLNFFRQTVLELRDNDPVEMYAYGAEGDVLRASAMFDKDLVLFGDQKQYAISGRAVLSPKSPNISVMSSHEDSTQAHPTSSGNLVFYGKQREGRTSVHQMQVGQLTESPESVEISQQLDTYLQGRPAQIAALTSPNTIVFRTEDVSGRLYVYSYMDTPAGNERLFDSWSSWEYPVENNGTIVAVSPHKGELLVFTVRIVDGQAYIIADRQSLSTELSPRPYMDSLRMYGSFSATSWHTRAAPVLDIAIGRGHESYLFGTTYADREELITQVPGCTPYLWVGRTTTAHVEPTNPYRRDQNGKAIVEGRLTLTQVTPSFANTAGMEFEVRTVNGTSRKVVHVERVMGDKDNIIGVQPVVTGRVVCSVGREVRECNYIIHAVSWMPLTITALSWIGQYFNRVRRAG